MGWRGDRNFKENLDRVTISLAKGACMGLATYITIKLIALAHDNKWSYLDSGWGQWFLFEIIVGFMLPLALMTYGVHTKKMGVIRTGAALTVFGVVLNRLNTAIITFNWKLPEREIPPWREVVISVTIFAIYLVVYRFILYRLPILYRWKHQEVPVLVHEAVRCSPAGIRDTPGVPVASYSSMTDLDRS
jgi:Ni/Fe-hydrogenase subunit HybB-like protein